MDLRAALNQFIKDNQFKGKGALSAGLVLTDHARKLGLPLDADKLVTESSGQVLKLGRSAVQAILKRHGITRVLAKEGGRTNRGNMGKMKSYVAFLNSLPLSADLEAVEALWIEKVNDFFSGQPFKLKLDVAGSMKALVRDLLAQAKLREKDNPGHHYMGGVMQHLVGAKLDCALGEGKVTHNCFSTADDPSGRVGDFFIEDAALHVTTAPTEALLEKCKENIHGGLKPIVLTIQRQAQVAEQMAENLGLGDRIDVFDVEQFVAANILEKAGFTAGNKRVAVGELVNRYNEIVEEFETDPSLKIEFLPPK